MGTLVGGLVVLVNGKTILDAWGGLPTAAGWALFLVAVAVPAVVAWKAWQRERQAATPELVDA
jgi:hypothetical protein